MLSASNRSQLTLPSYPQSAAELESRVKDLMAVSRKTVEALKSLTNEQLNFDSLMRAYDDLRFLENTQLGSVHLLQNTSNDEALRKAAQHMSVEFQNWAIERAYDKKLYHQFKTLAEKLRNQLSGESKKLLDESIRDYRRLGLDLSEDKQQRLQEIQRRLSVIETQFSTHINDYHDEIEVSLEDLEGLGSDFISTLKKTPDGRFRISLQYPEYLPVMEFAKNENLRRDLLIKKYSVASRFNIPLLDEMISLRDEMSEILGYASYNDYVTEERMAKNSKRVNEFLFSFAARLRPKAKSELDALLKLKQEETGDVGTSVHIWDYYYLASLYKKKFFAVDTKALKDYFPLDHVLQGFFDLIQGLFQVSFEEQNSADFYRWDEKVRLFKVYDRKTREELGAFYLDLFPRKGKYGHAAAFTLVESKYDKKEGVWRRPVSCMVCNFPETSPSLLSHDEVQTLFHEFGHILHNILSQTEFTKFAGTSVALDFVEAPSQVLENWVWDHEILELISKHHSNPNLKLGSEIVERMNRARKATSGLSYMRQVSYAITDLRFHSKGRPKNSTEIMNQTTEEFFLPAPANTFQNAGFGHMIGYASGYYGYAWADVMAADMFSKFREEGLRNSETGLRLRNEIYSTGSSRDENKSLEAFLGRPLSYDAFFEDLGL